ncbi:hypothetical protein PR048_019965 [Dryococelus australis]|uniref:Uncharacterized protein n=1 Tax=Dryococelus australis TaxID=614101 RepID=A0ABQ9H526_9NEOP|nr:hypothetical protein PR048_019965 [Dryococelus australis]
MSLVKPASHAAYAHQLNLIIGQCASKNKPARVFFSRIDGIPNFFLIHPNDRKWHVGFQGHLEEGGILSLGYENRDEFTECFETLESNQRKEIVCKARGFSQFLKESEFNFWHSFFQRIMHHVHILFQQMQSRQADSLIT